MWSSALRSHWFVVSWWEPVSYWRILCYIIKFPEVSSEHLNPQIVLQNVFTGIQLRLQPDDSSSVHHLIQDEFLSIWEGKDGVSSEDWF